jgi:3-methyladenine DNA glycosylase/8-oxoguanine DNA glycosylase
MGKMTLRAPADFGFLPTVYSHGWFQCPPFYWDAEKKVLTRVVRDAAGGPVILRIRAPSRSSLEVRAEVEAPLSDADRRRVRSTIRHLFQLDQEIGGFHDLCREHEHLAAVPQLGAGRFLRCPTVWEELVKAICGTNVQWSQAVRMISLIAELGEPIDGYHAWPTPGEALEAGEAELRKRCRVGYRAPYIVELARGLSEGSLDLGPIERRELGPEELRKAFLAIKGIGQATADYLMILNGFADRLSIDSAVYAYVTDRHFGGRRPSAAEIEKLYEPYGEWRALAYWFEALQEWWWGPTEFDFGPDPKS